MFLSKVKNSGKSLAESLICYLYFSRMTILLFRESTLDSKEVRKERDQEVIAVALVRNCDTLNLQSCLYEKVRITRIRR